MKRLIITIAIIVLSFCSALGLTSAMIAQQETATVPCPKEKCEALTLFNRAIELRNAEDDDLKQLEQSYLTSHPSLGTQAADRIKTLTALIEKADRVEAIYKDAARMTHERGQVYRRMLAIETK
jgi:hypothetical protein